MKTTKLLYLAIRCLILILPQLSSAQPTFHSAQWSNGTEVDSNPLGDRIPLIVIQGIQEDSSIWANVLSFYTNTPALQNNFKPYVFGYNTHSTTMTPDDPGDVFSLCPILGSFLQQSFGNTKVAILAHSAGGLVARAMMEYYTYPDGTRGGDRVSILITLATPHHGSPLANVYFDTPV